jgi:hypothetical protein
MTRKKKHQTVTIPVVTPQATRFATYPGNTTDTVGQIVGPNTLGERFTIVSAMYDPQTDKTRCGFACGVFKDVSE